jgi:hypothetical protein
MLSIQITFLPRVLKKKQDTRPGAAPVETTMLGLNSLFISISSENNFEDLNKLFLLKSVIEKYLYV